MRSANLLALLLIASLTACETAPIDPYAIGTLEGRYRDDKTRFFPHQRSAKEERLLIAALAEGEGFPTTPDNPELSAEQNLAARYDAMWFVVRQIGAGYAELGVVLGRVGLWEEAHKAFQIAARKKPDSAGTWGNLGVAGYVLGRYRQSEIAFQKALKLKPGYFDTRPNQKKFAENSGKAR